MIVKPYYIETHFHYIDIIYFFEELNMVLIACKIKIAKINCFVNMSHFCCECVNIYVNIDMYKHKNNLEFYACIHAYSNANVKRCNDVTQSSSYSEL